MPRKKRRAKQRLERVSVEAQRHTEPDWDRFAYALLQYARILVAEQPKQQIPAKRRGQRKPGATP